MLRKKRECTAGRPRQKRVTLADIANKVGCSKSAVSYAILRNHPLSEALKKRIWEAIEELGYQPYSHYGGADRKAVAILSDYTSGRIEELYYQELTKRGMIMQLYRLPQKICWESFQQTLGPFLAGETSLFGIIIQHPQINCFDLLRYCRNIPMVISSREGSMSSQGIIKLREIGTTAGRFLCYLNYPSGAFLYLPPAVPDYVQRIYQAAVDELKRRQSKMKFQRVEMSFKNGNDKQLDRLYDSGCRLFFAHSVCSAELILQWAYAQRLKLPEDLSLFCVDYAMEAEQMVPPLSAVSLPYSDLIRFTVDELSAQVAHTVMEMREFQPFISERASTVRYTPMLFT